MQGKGNIRRRFQKLEKFVLEVYSVRRCSSLAEARVEKFRTSPDSNLQKLPPGKDALMQHVKRAIFQVGYLWREAVSDFTIPDPTLWGWSRYKTGNYCPLWESCKGNISLSQLTVKCSCTANKCKKCKCAKAGIPCIGMCSCGKRCEAK